MTDVVLSTDTYNTGVDGFEFGFGDNLTIAAGILVGSVDQYGVQSFYDGSILVNNGNILSLLYSGVLFQANSQSITNNAGHSIIGVRGIELAGDGHADVNYGLVIGLKLAGIDMGHGSNHVVLVNYGEVYGRFQGVLAESLNEGGTITNAGLIRSDYSAILVDTKPALTTFITNQPHATIIGTNYSIFATAGAISLINLGTIVGDIVCGTSDESDVIVNHGTINGSVYLSSGHEVYNGKGGFSGPIFGGGGDDRIIGGKGNVAIHVGGGNDTLTAGPGHDQFIFDGALGGQVDRITNFKHGLDKIVLSEAYFMAIGQIGHPLAPGQFHVGPAVTPQQHIIYTPGNGFLSYDANGSAPGGKTHFATLTTHPALHHSDFIVEA